MRQGKQKANGRMGEWEPAPPVLPLVLSLLCVALSLSLACSRKSPVTSESPPAAVEQPAGNRPRVSEPVDEAAGQSAVAQTQLTYEQSNGQILYLRYCAVCHGKTGEGDGFNAYNLRPAVPRNFTDKEAMDKLTDRHLAEVISKGGQAVGRSPLMPAWGHTVNERQIRYLISYLRTMTTVKPDSATN